MTIAVAIICAVLGIVVGYLVARIKGAQRENDGREEGFDMEKRVVALQIQLDAETQKNTATREEADRQLAAEKESADKRVAEAKEAAANQLQQERERSAQALADERNAADKRIAEVKADAELQLKQEKERSAQALAAEREAGEKRFEKMKQEKDEVHQKAMDELRSHFDDISKGLMEQAKNVTNEMLKQRSEEISKSGHTTMEQLVNPLKESIDNMKKAMNDTTVEQVKTNTELKEKLSAAIQSNDKTTRTADDLIRAFKHDSKIQGDWGECVLEELLSSLGLQEGIHFETQVSLRGANGRVLVSEETGSKMRPDVVVHLDATKDVIVDSKVSMAAFLDYKSAEDPDERKKRLKDHVDSIEKHVKELSGKKYADYVKPPRETIDFVIMFVPRADALWTALTEKPSLWRESMEKGVYIADEQTLYAALRIVKLTWRQVQQAKNQQEVFRLANEMIKRVGAFVKQMDNVKTALKNAQKAYDAGMLKFADKGQSVLTTCHQLENLGAKQDSAYPLPDEIQVIEMQSAEGEA